MRIVIISKRDLAGSGQRFAYALRAAGHTCANAAFFASNYGAPLDMLVPLVDVRELQWLIDKADVVHFKGDWLPSEYPNLVVSHKPVVITVGGSGFRRSSTGRPARNWELRWHPIAKYVKQSQARGALTPDLLYPDFQGTWTPHATIVANRWKAPRNGHPIIIGHSPSNPEVKGTDTIVRPAVAALNALGHNVELRVIHGKSNAECLQIKATCHLFIDQCHVPAYGLSAVEAMGMGIPLVTLLPVEHPDMQPCPIIAMHRSSATELLDCLRAILEPSGLITRLKYMNRATLAYAHRIHGQAAVAKRLVALYRKAIAAHKAKKHAMA